MFKALSTITNRMAHMHSHSKSWYVLCPQQHVHLLHQAVSEEKETQTSRWLCSGVSRASQMLPSQQCSQLTQKEQGQLPSQSQHTQTDLHNLQSQQSQTDPRCVHSQHTQAQLQPVQSQYTQTVCHQSQSHFTQTDQTTTQALQGQTCLHSQWSQASVLACDAHSQTDNPEAPWLVALHSQYVMPVQDSCSQTTGFSGLHSLSQHTQTSVTTAAACCQTGSQEGMCHTSTQTPASASTTTVGCQASNEAELCSVATQVQLHSQDACSQTLGSDEQQEQTVARLQEVQEELAGLHMKVQSLQTIVDLQEQQLQKAASQSGASGQVCSCKITVLL